MRNIFLIAFFLLNPCLIKSQIYHPLLSNGKIPSVFTEWPSFRDAEINMSTKKSRFEIKAEQNYQENLIHIIDYYCRSGKICFNSPLNNYINSIADYILSDNPKLRSELNFYIIKDEEYNASTFGDGTILINIGLLAKVENEAQLAFILAHEISHYVNDDARLAYIEKSKSKTGKEEYKKLNYDSKKLRLSNYSKQQEFKADSDGYNNIYCKTGYSSKEVVDVFKDTYYSYLPVKSSKNLLQYLDSLGCIFTDTSLMIMEKNKLPAFIVDDSLSTHPLPEKRMENISSFIKKDKNESQDKEFIISKSGFESCQQKAMQELIHIELQSQMYEEAICNSLALLDQGTNNEYAELAIGLSLMQLCSYKSKDDLFYIQSEAIKYHPEYNFLHIVFDKMPEKDLALMSTSYNHQLNLKYPDKKEFTQLLRESMRLLVMEFNFSKDSIQSLLNNNTLSNVEKTSMQWAKDSLFLNALLTCNLQKQEIEKEKQELISNKEKRLEIAERNRMIQKEGFALGIDSIVIINPMSIMYNSRSGDGLQLKDADITRHSLINTMITESDKIDLKIKFLDIKYNTDNNVEEYNNYCMLSDWFNEKCSHYSDDYFVYSGYFLDKIVEEYNTKYFVWIGLSQNKSDRLIDSKNSVLDLYLFSIETNELIVSLREWINDYNNEKLIKKALVKLFNQIKNERI